MTNPVSLELQAKINAWRQRAAEGTLTLDEMKEAILYLRQDRMQAATSAAATKRKKAIIAIPSAADMLSDLENL